MMSKSFLTRVLAQLRQRKPGTNDVDRILELLREGAFPEAYGALNEALRKAPQLSEAALIHIIRADLELRVNKDISAAQKSLDRASEIGCGEIPEYYEVRGDVKFTTGDFTGAIADYDQSVALDHSVDKLVMLAQALSYAEDKRATDVWAKVLKEDPQNCLAHVWLAWEAVRAGNRDKALTMAKKAQQLNPSAKDDFEIGRIYQTLGEFQVAISAYLRADELGYDDHKGRTYAAVAACYLDLAQGDQARRYAERAVACDPEDEYVKTVWHMCRAKGN